MKIGPKKLDERRSRPDSLVIMNEASYCGTVRPLEDGAAGAVTIYRGELRTLRTQDTSALVWWVRTVRTDRHWCRSVLKTVRT